MNRIYLTSALALLAGCTGLIGSGDGEGGAGKPGGPGSDELACVGNCIGESGMLRLTRQQFAYSVQAVFGSDVVVDQDRLPIDSTVGPFKANDGTVTEATLSAYQASAWVIAAQVAPALAASCSASTCASDLLEEYGQALFRRPITEEDTAAYGGLFTWSMGEDTLEASVEIVVATMLQAPEFIYRVERVGDELEPTALTGGEVAARLALFLWLEGPDEQLRVAAANGDLQTADGVVEQARRMLDDRRADRAISVFHRQWLGIEEIPDLDPALSAAMRAETEAFAVQVVRDGDGTLDELLTSTVATVTSPLAQHYGVGAGDNVEIPGRVGILTHGSVLSQYASASYTRPVRRGNMLLHQVLCQSLGTPPSDALDNANAAAGGLDDALSDRAKLAAITEVGTCANCHSLINPAGYVFENFDAMGVYREVDGQGNALDSSGAFSGMGDLDGAFDGPGEFMPRLAQSEVFGRCFSEQWFRFAMQREPSSDEDEALEAVFTGLVESGGQIRDVLIGVVATDAFRYRMPRGL